MFTTLHNASWAARAQGAASGQVGESEQVGENEWRKVWLVAGVMIPDESTARRTAFCITLGSR